MQKYCAHDEPQLCLDSNFNECTIISGVLGAERSFALIPISMSAQSTQMALEYGCSFALIPISMSAQFRCQMPPHSQGFALIPISMSAQSSGGDRALDCGFALIPISMSAQFEPLNM